MGQSNKDISRVQSHAAMMQSHAARKQAVEPVEADEKEEEEVIKQQHDPSKARRELTALQCPYETSTHVLVMTSRGQVRSFPILLDHLDMQVDRASKGIHLTF